MTEPRSALVLLGRADCPLCDDMRAALKPWTARFHVTIEEIDITGKAELEARYGWDIPVLLAGETEICRHFLDERALQSWLAGQGS